MFFNDSNTYGYDPRSFFGGRYPEDVCWTGILGRRLAPETAVYADGMNGRSVPASENEITAAKCSVEHASPLDLFAVMLGSNDLLDGREEAEKLVRITTSRLQRFLERIANQDSNGNSQPGSWIQSILVISPLQIEPGSWGNDTLERERVMLKEAYRRMAAQWGWDFVDSALWNCELSTDGVHLSAAGHRTFADQMEKVLSELI
jgi:lysophospholipase L1-like esterase